MKTHKFLRFLFLFGLLVILVVACQPEDKLRYERPKDEAPSTNPIDVYVKKNITDPYGALVLWRWENRFVRVGQSATPVDPDMVIPTTKILQRSWITPFVEQSKDVAKLFKELIPKEIVYIGSPVYKRDGSIILGLAEAGARITLFDLNEYLHTDDISEWTRGQLWTVHHEFTHIINQRYGRPSGFGEITPEGYLGEAWVRVPWYEAIRRGMVTPYATKNEWEDIAETAAAYLVNSEADFKRLYLPSGRYFTGNIFIERKVALLKSYYRSIGVDLELLRDSVVVSMERDRLRNP